MLSDPAGDMHVSLSEVEAAVVKAVMSVGLGPGLGEDAGRAAKLMLRSGLGTFADLVGALDAVDGGASVGLDPDRVPAGVLAAATGPAGRRLNRGADGFGRDSATMPSGGRFRPDEGDEGGAGRAGDAVQLSALVAGPTACDLLMAAARGAAGIPRAVTLVAVDYPGVVLHQLLDASHAIDGHAIDILVRVTWSAGSGAGAGGDSGGGTRIEVVCRAGAVWYESDALAGVFGAGPADMSVRLAESTADFRAGLPGGDGPGDDGLGAEIDDAVWRRLSAYAERHLVEGDERSRLTGAGAGVIDTD